MTIVGKPKSLDEEYYVGPGRASHRPFLFVHSNNTDSRGEDGNFAEKVKMIEKFDSIVPRVESLKPTVLAVTGDHMPAGWPATVGTRSRRPPLRPDGSKLFGEGEAIHGGLGHFEAIYLMSLAMAHAGRLAKSGPTSTIRGLFTSPPQTNDVSEDWVASCPRLRFGFVSASTAYKSMTYVFATDPRYLAWVASTVEGYDDVKETIDDLPDFDAHLTAYLRG